MTRMSVGTFTLNVEVDGCGPSLMMLHGFTGSARTWDPFVKDLAAQFTVYRVDLPGHGLSDSPPDAARYRVEECGSGLLTLCDVLRLDQVNLLGYSMGGRVALRLALDSPHHVRALVLESASPGIESEGDRCDRVRADEALAASLERDGLDAFIDHWECIPLFRSQASLPAAARNALRRQRLDNNPTGLANSLRGLGAGVAEPHWHRLPSLTVPTLLIAGEIDEKYRALGQRMSGLLPRSRLVVIPGAGHAVHLEQPDLFLQAAISFLSGSDTGPAGKTEAVPALPGPAIH
jgi:2-succinyl-6-hydroxy-2,4-cyclohexadiene-1-carboxylate synthase